LLGTIPQVASADLLHPDTVSLCTNTVASAQIQVQESIIFAESAKTSKKLGGTQECYSKTALGEAHYKEGMTDLVTDVFQML
jgi:hypothetical protein